MVKILSGTCWSSKSSPEHAGVEMCCPEDDGLGMCCPEHVGIGKY